MFCILSVSYTHLDVYKRQPELHPAVYLAFFFIFFSVVVIINPHSLRSMLTFGFFAINVLMTIKTASIQIGCFIIAVIVIYRHLIKHNNGPVRISILHQR